jgi:hypothetical protein
MARTVSSLVLTVLLCIGSVALAKGANSSQLNPCAAPNKLGASFEETAWRIWVVASCPVNDHQYPFVVWENWIEQSQLFPTDPSKGFKVPNAGAATATHIVHESPLTLALHPELAHVVPSGSGEL